MENQYAPYCKGLSQTFRADRGSDQIIGLFSGHSGDSDRICHVSHDRTPPNRHLGQLAVWVWYIDGIQLFVCGMLFVPCMDGLMDEKADEAFYVFAYLSQLYYIKMAQFLWKY